MTTQPAPTIVRYSALHGSLQRIELSTAVISENGELVHGYRVTKINTSYRNGVVRPSWDEGNKLNEREFRHLTFATPLEACQNEVEIAKDIVELYFYELLNMEHGSLVRAQFEASMEANQARLAQAEGLLLRQTALSAHEWYWVTDQWVIQIEQPMAANDETRDMMLGGQITYPMMSGYVTTLAGEYGRSEWFHGEVATFDNSLESATVSTLESIFPNEEDLGSKWIVNEIQNVLKMAEAAVVAKGLAVHVASPSKMGKDYSQWRPFTRSDVCGDGEVEAITAWMRFGPPERFAEAAKLLRELV